MTNGKIIVNLFEIKTFKIFVFNIEYIPKMKIIKNWCFY